MRGVKDSGVGPQIERSRKWRSKNTAAAVAATKKWRQKRPGYVGPKRQEMVDRLASIKRATPCFDCGGFFAECCMDYDHVSGIKVAGVSQLIALCRPWVEVEAELTKCQLVCANCHRIRTRDRFYTLENDAAPKGQAEAAAE